MNTEPRIESRKSGELRWIVLEGGAGGAIHRRTLKQLAALLSDSASCPTPTLAPPEHSGSGDLVLHLAEIAGLVEVGGTARVQGPAHTTMAIARIGHTHFAAFRRSTEGLSEIEVAFDEATQVLTLRL